MTEHDQRESLHSVCVDLAHAMTNADGPAWVPRKSDRTETELAEWLFNWFFAHPR